MVLRRFAIKSSAGPWLGLLGLTLVGLIFALKGLNPNASEATVLRIQTSAVVEATRRDLVWSVSGNGLMVAEDLAAISSLTQGVVRQIHVKPGDPVNVRAPLLTLANPELEHDVLEAESDLTMAESQLRDLVGQLRKERLYEQAELARLDADYKQAQLRAERDEGLYNAGLLIPLTFQQSKIAAELAAAKLRIEKERAKVLEEIGDEQVTTQKMRVEQLRSSLSMKRSRRDSLLVKADVAGVIQEIAIGLGQHVSSGSLLAKIVDPKRLSAKIRIPDVQAQFVRSGQSVRLMSGDKTFEGRVHRVEPHTQQGVVVVSVELRLPVPSGAKAGSLLDGVIETERTSNSVCVPRSSMIGASTEQDIFVLDEPLQTAMRRKLRLGRSTTALLEVVSGLSAGERFIVVNDPAIRGQASIRVQVE